MKHHKALLKALRMVLITTVILVLVNRSIDYDSNYRINLFNQIYIEKEAEKKPSAATNDFLK